MILRHQHPVVRSVDRSVGPGQLRVALAPCLAADRLPPTKCGITPPSVVVLIWSRSPLFGPISPCIYQLSILLHFPLRDGLTFEDISLGRLPCGGGTNQPRGANARVVIPPQYIHYRIPICRGLIGSSINLIVPSASASAPGQPKRESESESRISQRILSFVPLI